MGLRQRFMILSNCGEVGGGSNMAAPRHRAAASIPQFSAISSIFASCATCSTHARIRVMV